MPYQLEVALKNDLHDAEGESIRQKAFNYLGIRLASVRSIHILTFDIKLNEDQRQLLQNQIFTNPVTQISSFQPLPFEFDWTIWVGYRPGVRDNPGSTAVEALTDLLKIKLQPGEDVYTSRRFCLIGDNPLRHGDVNQIAAELLANDIIQQWKIFAASEWDPKVGIGFNLPKVILNHTPEVRSLTVESDEALKRVSDERNLAINRNDIPVIRAYFTAEKVIAERAVNGLQDPTDVELEYLSQARSDHCNHNTFQGFFHYTDLGTGQKQTFDNLFKTFIQEPTLLLKEKKNWVVSVLWDNAGVGRFDKDHYYVITGETHNSPSNMEAYGGAITGIVGVYRDPMGTGKGAKLVMGGYGYCVGELNYQGELKPRLHPRRLLDGVIEGVRDGGNKSGIPTTFGQVLFHPGYMGKCLVFVTAVGLMPAEVAGQPAEMKSTAPGDLIVMCGGRVGKDGIHGVTASSEIFSKHTPAGHVQIGDPYTQKKMHDFLLEAREEGLITFITDNGGGGLSSSIGESARFSNGCRVQLEKVPLKYEGLDQWEIWVSESQERMTVAVRSRHWDRFFELSQKHAVESTVIGTYTDTGKLHITYQGKTCAYIDLDLVTAGFPQWQFEAEWIPPEQRGLHEPVLTEPLDYNRLLLDVMARPNICAKNWITRQYDHEVQGTSVIKPLIGVERDINSDAAVIRPVLDSNQGLGFAQALLPGYSAIDAYHMTACVIDEAVRRVLAVGGRMDHMGGVDNFCWPNIQYHPTENPDGKFKAAQLVRSCRALRKVCLAYEIPLLSGKDSMYVDGRLPGSYGETHKISALETLQFSTIGLIDDIAKCVTMESKVAGDLIYIIGETRDELGGSEYYEHLGYVGANVPQVFTEHFKYTYQSLQNAIEQEQVASCHGVYRGGLAVHLALMAMGGMLGLNVSLKNMPAAAELRSDTILFAESCGRFIVTVDPNQKEAFEELLDGCSFGCIGTVTENPFINIRDVNDQSLVSLSVEQLKAAWKKPFGDMI
jgi:phosphoribosylformylglycinamidine synthase